MSDSTNILNAVVKELVDVLRKGLKETIVSADSIIIDRPFFDDDKLKRLPLIAIYDDGFDLEEIGFGGAAGEIKDEKKEEFSGDGKKTKFKLSGRALRPILDVQVQGSRAEEFQDYRMDYAESVITFFYPPQKGQNNIRVRYTIDKSLGEIKGLRIKTTYFFEIWSKDRDTNDSFTTDVMKALLLGKGQLMINGITLNPQRGVRLFGETDVSRRLYGRRLVYQVQADLKIEIRTPAIKEVEISENKYD